MESPKKNLKKKQIVKENLTEVKNNIEVKTNNLEDFFKKVGKDSYLKLKDNKKIFSLYELLLYSKEISKDVFDFHLNNTKNDFKTWIKMIVRNEILAERLNNITAQHALTETLGSYLIELLNKECEDLKNKISELRKGEKYTTIAEIKFMAIPTKIIMAKATYDKKDIERVVNLIGDLKKELEMIENEKSI